MSPKVQTSWAEIREELNQKLAQYCGDYRELSMASGISYDAARRFVLNGAKNWTKTAEKLCLHFCIIEKTTATDESENLQGLIQLLEQTWDGSAAHAELLAKLIISTRSFKVEERRRPH